MSVLAEIHKWSTTQRPFLRDALRRLLQSNALAASDFDDLYALLKLEAGILDAKNRVPVPLDATHLPSATVEDLSLKLLSLKKFKHVNRIAEDQTLQFEPRGLTVIYGDNGTGKSGYSRVLKLACRARDQNATVLPNAHLQKADQGVPEAKFVVDVNGKETVLQWRLGSSMHIDLSALSVFDSTCARAYLDAEQDVAYLPYGLDLVENLAKVVLPALDERLSNELATCTVDPVVFKDLHGPTAVGKLIDTLSADTDPALVESLATLDESESARRTELYDALHQSNPKVKAAELRRTGDRLKQVLDRVGILIQQLDDKACEFLKLSDEKLQSSINAMQIVAERLRSGDDLLPGTGGPEWQALFQSARKYALIAHQDKAFPISSTNSRCLLCQQELIDGVDRLKRFDEFIKNDTATVAEQKQREMAQSTDRLSRMQVSFGIDTALLEEVEVHNEMISAALFAFETRLQKRKEWLQKSLETHAWIDRPELAPDPRDDVTALLESLKSQAEAYVLASDEATRLEMQKEFDELDAQAKLAPRKQLLLDAINTLKRRKGLEACSEHIKSRPITNKCKELTDRAVTQALSDALNKEFAALQIDHLKTKLKSRASDGKMYHKLVLDVPQTQKLHDILSEGELRALAIASFLAELALSGQTGGAIFDDPVSSLDHFRRIRVAKRLVQEAKKRQVIVFTHDSIFLGELKASAENNTVPCKFCHLEWTKAEYSGYCNDGLPWHHQGFDDRIDALEKKQRELKREWSANPSAALNDRMRVAYSHFRATVERAVETVFLNGVVRRFNNYIPVKELENVVSLTKAEFDEVYRLFSLASDVTEAHDAASGSAAPVPTPDEFDLAIKALKDVVNAYRDRKKGLP